MRHLINRFQLKYRTIAWKLRSNDRGEINSSVAWTGAMVLLAVGIAGVIAAKASGFAEGIDFGG